MTRIRNGFLNMISKAQATKGIKQIKSDTNKMKSFCVKRIINKKNRKITIEM